MRPAVPTTPNLPILDDLARGLLNFGMDVAHAPNATSDKDCSMIAFDPTPEHDAP